MRRTTVGLPKVYAILYARVSEDRTEKLLSPRDQMDVLKKRAKQLGWIVLAAILEEDPISASKYSKRVRKGYAKLLKALETEPKRIRATEPDAVFILAADESSRVTRKGVEREHLFDICEEHGVLINYSGAQYDPSNPDQRLMLTFVGAADTHRSGATSREVQRRLNARVAEGRNIGRMPLGYVPIGIDPKSRLSLGWELDGVKSKAMKRAMKSILDGKSGESGDSVNAAKVLYEKLTGDRINYSSFRAGIVRPAYAGIQVHKGVVVGRGKWPALISEDEHYRLVAILTNPDRDKRVHRGVAPRHLCSGSLKCHKCKTFHSAVLWVGTGKIETYVCREKGCFGFGRKAATVDMVVERAMKKLLTDPRVINGAQRGPDDEYAEEREELREIETTLDAYYDAAALPAGHEEHISRKALARIEARLNPRAESLRQLLTTTSHNPMLAQYAGKDAAQRWDEEFPLSVQRSLVRSCLDITIMPLGKGRRKEADVIDSIDIRWNGSVRIS